MNMIRVWGGGVYENDYFYDLADENGILVWQDFMFACTPYPADPPFLKKVAEEAEYNIRRLRNHACLAMWCGNNEIEEGIKYWGWQKRFDADVYKRFGTDYRKLFHELLPAQVAKFDEGRFYMHTSPYFANWGRPESWSVRDSHNWGTWYGRKPFEYRSHPSRPRRWTCGRWTSIHHGRIHRSDRSCYFERSQLFSTKKALQSCVKRNKQLETSRMAGMMDTLRRMNRYEESHWVHRICRRTVRALRWTVAPASR